MQSSARNCLPARVNVSSQARAPSSVGDVGPNRRGSAVLAPTASEVAQRRPDTTGEDEPGDERTDDDERQLRAQSRRDVGRVADLTSELGERGGQLASLLLEIAANLSRRASVRAG